MAPIGKLYGFAGNSRFRRALAVATYCGLDVETDPNFSMKDGAWKTPEFLQKFPFGYLPAFEGTDGLCLQECGAIADYFASLAPNCDLVPTDKDEAALVRQWQDFADQELVIRSGVAMRMHANRLPYSKPVFDGIVNEVVGRLETLDKILLKKTYIVGERLTIADIFLATALAIVYSVIIDASHRDKLPNTVRYMNTILRNPKIAKVFDNGKIELLDKLPAYQGVAKEKKAKEPKADKPKAEPKPKAAPAPAADEDDEPKPAPKVKNPLDDLPKSSFNLEEWKRQYSNLKQTRGPGSSTQWFFDNYDPEGFSIWRFDFRWNEELTMTFMSNNQIGGFFNRMEASRKYVFGVGLVLGTNNNSMITGLVVCRGQDYVPVMNVAPDWESYEFTRLDLAKPEDKKFFEDVISWDLAIDGRECADGKDLK